VLHQGANTAVKRQKARPQRPSPSPQRCNLTDRLLLGFMRDVRAALAAAMARGAKLGNPKSVKVQGAAFGCARGRRKRRRRRVTSTAPGERIASFAGTIDRGDIARPRPLHRKERRAYAR
jgi:hypothetical protein